MSTTISERSKQAKHSGPKSGGPIKPAFNPTGVNLGPHAVKGIPTTGGVNAQPNIIPIKSSGKMKAC